MKVKATWLPSRDNRIADACSRNPLDSGRVIAGKRFQRVKAKWENVTRFCNV